MKSLHDSLKPFLDNPRKMPWRDTTDPYAIMVSELMLQQTQVPRVIPKYELFMKAYPTIEDLAKAKFSGVLRLWDGLGYNRRAKYLHDIAKELAGSVFPDSIEALSKQKGIGANTAAAILVYSTNKPHVFIETNIRAVFIHHFFSDKSEVEDADIFELVSKELEQNDPRAWYWALMDYGTHLKQTLPNPSRKSKHHTTQSKFEGSDRQLRARILKHLLNGEASVQALQKELNDKRVHELSRKLAHEGLVQINEDKIVLAKS